MFVLQTRSGLANAINEQRPVYRYLEDDKSLLKREEKEEEEDDKNVKEGADYKVASVDATNMSGKNDDRDNDDEQMVNHVCDSEHC